MPTEKKYLKNDEVSYPYCVGLISKSNSPDLGYLEPVREWPNFLEPSKWYFYVLCKMMKFDTHITWVWIVCQNDHLSGHLDPVWEWLNSLESSKRYSNVMYLQNDEFWFPHCVVLVHITNWTFLGALGTYLERPVSSGLSKSYSNMMCLKNNEVWYQYCVGLHYIPNLPSLGALGTYEGVAKFLRTF